MKKELLTEQDYLDAHLKEFEAMYNGEIVKGIVFVDDDKNVYLLQNSNYGSDPKNQDWKINGFKFSWCQFFNNKKNISAMENVTIEQWQPKFGELVLSYDSESDCDCSPHIFLFEKNGVYHCVSESKNDIKEFNSSEIRNEYRVFKFRYVKQIETPKPIEISLEEAKEIIAKEKGIKAEQVNLKFKIN